MVDADSSSSTPNLIDKPFGQAFCVAKISKEEFRQNLVVPYLPKFNANLDAMEEMPLACVVKVVSMKSPEMRSPEG